eukprot:scaffold2883_cov102-Skeletonema_dohrnii-CCMP3373.AAC.4
MEGVSVGNNSAAGRAAGVGRGASTNEENEGNDCAHSSNEIGGGHSGLASSSFSEEAHGHPLRRSSRGNVPRYSSDPMLECSDDDDDDSDEDYTDGKDKDPTNGNIEKEEEDSVEEEDAVKEEDSLDKQSVATLRQKCKALGLKVGGTKADIINRIRNHDDDNDDGDKKPSAKKSRDDGTDDGNKKPRTSRPKQYSATPEGEPLWSNSRNTRLETEEYLRRSRTIKENPHLEGCNAPLAQWEEAFPGEGEMMQRWYKLNTRVLVTSEDDFHLDVLIYYDYSGRELGEMCQQFSDYCLDRVGNARISFPTRYSIAMEAVYHHGNFKMYTFLRALDYVITDASRRHENQNFIRARRLQEILENNYSLTTSTKSDERDIIQEEDYEVSYNSLFLEFAGVPPPPKLRVYPNVNKVCEAITAAVKETYAPESKASQLLVALQRGLCEKVKSTPELFKSLTTNQRNDMYSYRAFTELLARDGKDCDKCTTVQSVGTAEAAGDAFYQPIHNMSIDHNGLMAVWLKHLYQGKSPSASSWDDLMAQYALSQVFDWMAEWGNNNDEMMNWDQFNQDLSPLTRVNAHNGINGKCSLEMPCMSHHLCKDCSKGTRHLAGAALPGEVSSHAMRTINHKITNKLKMDVSNGKSALSNYCFTYLELPGVSFHHTSALSPVSVMEASKCRELMLDMKKEVSARASAAVAERSANREEEEWSLL